MVQFFNCDKENRWKCSKLNFWRWKNFANQASPVQLFPAIHKGAVSGEVRKLQAVINFSAIASLRYLKHYWSVCKKLVNESFSFFFKKTLWLKNLLLSARFENPHWQNTHWIVSIHHVARKLLKTILINFLNQVFA